MKKDTSKHCSIDNYTVILSKSEGAHTSEILRSLRSLRMTRGKCIKKVNHFLTSLPTNLLTFKPAFTLAEVLITLGIIGVVAAITIPGLITAYKKHVIGSSLKRAVSSINQAIKQSETENGEMETWNKSLEQEEFINLYIRPYMNIALTCKNITKCGYKSNKAWKNLNGQYNTYYEPTAYKRVPFITMDGILYAFANNNFTTTVENNDKIILIDINGPKPPNMHGQDVFLLYRKEAEDSIIPYGAGLPLSEIKRSCNKNERGLYCAAWIYQNGWNIPSGYPLR